MSVINDIDDDSQLQILTLSEQNEGNKTGGNALTAEYAMTQTDEEEKQLATFNLSKDYMIGESNATKSEVNKSLSTGHNADGNPKKAGKKKIKRGLKRKVKIPPQWPGQIPATRRITIDGKPATHLSTAPNSTKNKTAKVVTLFSKKSKSSMNVKSK